MKIEDNFLDQEKFDELQILMMGDNFAWYFNKVIVYNEVGDKFQFTHTFYKNFAHRAIEFIRHQGIETPIFLGGPYPTGDYENILMNYNNANQYDHSS